MRLDKYISFSQNVTRSIAHKYISDGRIMVNSQIIKKKDWPILEEVDDIQLDGKKIEYHKFIYIMLNKPKNVISAVKDKENLTVVDLIKERNDVFPVGRLDKDTEGLLILTNNGKLAHKLTSPNYHVNKKYYVITKENILLDDINKFNEGLEIYDGNNDLFITKPAKLEIIDQKTCFVTICEGKYHQVKNMFKKVNNEVIYLKRITMGNISLDTRLKPGEYRYLLDEEIQEIKRQFD